MEREQIRKAEGQPEYFPSRTVFEEYSANNQMAAPNF